MAQTPEIGIKRVYDLPEPADGVRVLVDGLWPRGLSRERARADHWAKAVAPSTELRRWFGHDPERWDEFRRRYFAELDANRTAVAELRRRIGAGPATLLFAAKDRAHNNAVALKAYLERAAG